MRISIISWAAALLTVHILAAALAASETIHQGKRDLQEVINAAPDYATVACDPSVPQTISTPIVISKPLTLQGLNARLPAGLGDTALLKVESEHVTLLDLYLYGNADSVHQDDRAPLVEIRKSNFRVERCTFENASKDGLMISPLAGSDDISGGVARDIVGRGVIRDVVSMSGDGQGGSKVRNILVENIRGYNSELRGVVEVSDGTDNITVRKVYAENCAYGIDIQDHGEKVEINRNIVISDLFAKNCKYAIRNANHPFGHANITISDVTAIECERSLELKNTDMLTLTNVRIIDQTGDGDALLVNNCDGVTLRDIRIAGGAAQGAGLKILNCSDIQVDGLSIVGGTSTLKNGIKYLITDNDAFANLQISHVFAPNVQGAGISLENTSESGSLSDYIVSDTIGGLEDLIAGPRRVLHDNL